MMKKRAMPSRFSMVGNSTGADRYVFKNFTQFILF